MRTNCNIRSTLTHKELEQLQLVTDRLRGRPRACPQCQSQVKGRLWHERHDRLTCPVCGFVLEDNRRARTP